MKQVENIADLPIDLRSRVYDMVMGLDLREDKFYISSGFGTLSKISMVVLKEKIAILLRTCLCGVDDQIVVFSVPRNDVECLLAE